MTLATLDRSPEGAHDDTPPLSRLQERVLYAPRGKRREREAELRKSTHDALRRDVEVAEDERRKRRWWLG